jgi:hypothetical protein
MFCAKQDAYSSTAPDDEVSRQHVNRSHTHLNLKGLTNQDGSLQISVSIMLRRQKGTALSIPHHRRMRSLQYMPCRRSGASFCGSTAQRTGLSCKMGPDHPGNRRLQSPRTRRSSRSVAGSRERIRNSCVQQSLLQPLDTRPNRSSRSKTPGGLRQFSWIDKNIRPVPVPEV